MATGEWRCAWGLLCILNRELAAGQSRGGYLMDLFREVLRTTAKGTAFVCSSWESE